MTAGEVEKLLRTGELGGLFRIIGLIKEGDPLDVVLHEDKRGKLTEWCLSPGNEWTITHIIRAAIPLMGGSNREEWIRWGMEVADRCQGNLFTEVVRTLVARRAEDYTFFRGWLSERVSPEEARSLLWHSDDLYRWQVITGCIFDPPGFRDGWDGFEKIANECVRGVSEIIEEVASNRHLFGRERLAWILYSRGLVNTRYVVSILHDVHCWGPSTSWVVPYICALVEKREVPPEWASSYLKIWDILRLCREEAAPPNVLREIIRSSRLSLSEYDLEHYRWEPVIIYLGADLFYEISIRGGIPPYLVATYLGEVVGGEWESKAVAEIISILDKGELPSRDFLPQWKKWGLPERYVEMLKKAGGFQDLEVNSGVDISLSRITWGVEIETVAPDHLVGGQIEIGEYHSGEGTIGYLPDWRAEEDSSITHDDDDGYVPCEVISPVLRGKKGIKILRKAANALREHGHIVNESCGFHVHVGWNPKWPSVHLARLVKLVYVWEDALWEITGDPSRKDNGFAGSLKRNGSCRMAMNRAQVNRYTMLNLTNLVDKKRDTVEFRLFPASLNADVLAAWVQVCLGLVEIALSDRDIPEEGGKAEDLLAYLGWTGSEEKAWGLLERESKEKLAKCLLNRASIYYRKKR